MIPKNAYTSEPVSLFPYMVFADMIKLRTLRWRDYPGLAWKAGCNHKGPYKGRSKAEEPEERGLQRGWRGQGMQAAFAI